MKRIHVGLMALAAIAGAASAFTTVPGRFAPVRVYAIPGTGGNAFSYTDVQPALPASCKANTSSICIISTNVPLSTLNSSFTNTFPAENDGVPSTNPNYLNYVGAANTLYK